MKVIKKSFSILLAAAVLSTSTGCFGEFALVRGLYEWNDSVTSNKFVKTLLFYGLSIIPVYAVAALGDVVIFNLIEFWSGSNPISMNEGDFERETIPMDGEEYIVEATKNQFKIYQEGQDPVYLRFDISDQSWNYVDNQGNSEKLISRKINEDGDNYLVYKDESVISLDANTAYSEEMLNYLFTEKTLTASK